MKDKRLYLKLAYVTEFIYIFIALIYYLFFVENSDEKIANLFFLVINFVLAIMLYKESKKDIDYLKENRFIIIISGLFFFFDSILPGILCYIFLRNIKTKKDVKLPIIKKEKKSIKDYIKSFILIFIFLLIMFIMPMFDFYNKIPSFIIYIFILALIFILNYKELISDFKIFIKNFKIYLPFIIKRYFKMLFIMLLVGVPIVLINNGKSSSNQILINQMFTYVPFFTFILTTLYAPLAEESIFRLALSKFFNNKTLFIIISGLLFGSLHIIDKFTSLNDLLYIFQYSALGMCLAKAYSDSNNIYVSISIHFIQNFISAVLVLLLF